MNLTYEIKNYYPMESRIYCEFTPEDTSLETWGGWISISISMTEEQIKEQIVKQAPYFRWDIPQINEFATNLVNSSASITRPVKPAKTTADEIAQIVYEITNAITIRLDKFALERGYDNIVSACSYVNSTVPSYVAEAQRCIELRDNTWQAFNNIVPSITAETVMSDILSQLPILSWEV